MDQIFQNIQDSAWTPAWLAPVREKAYTRFKQRGWPTRDLEDWRYTSTKALAQTAFAASPAAVSFGLPWRNLYLAEAAYRLVFLNGRYLAEESIPFQGPGLTIAPLEEALSLSQAAIEAFLSRDSGSSLGALNQALFNSGVFIQLDRGLKLDGPLQILHIQSGMGTAAVISPCHLLKLGEGAEAVVLESYFSFEDDHFVNASTEVQLEAGAQLQLITEKVLSPSSLHINRSRFFLRRDARLQSFTLNLGGQINRHEQKIELEESGSSVQFDGLYIARGNSHIDMNTNVQHRAPHTTSSQIYKGILHDKARAVFDGKIAIAQHAQQTRADQLNKNLLMSDEAEIDTKPQLRIDADDVKCSHGATVGRLDRNELFYLQSRGIDKETGARLLSQAFVRDVLNRVKNASLEQRLEQIVGEHSGEETRP